MLFAFTLLVELHQQALHHSSATSNTFVCINLDVSAHHIVKTNLGDWMHHRKVDSQGRIINAVHEHVHGMPVVWAFLQIHSQASVNAQRSELVSDVVVLSV